MFPMAVVALLVKETNDYFTFCTTTPTRNEDDKREDRHKAKEPTNGRASWPDGGITANMMYTVIGIVLTLGLVRLPEIANHWDVSDYHDFKLVRQSMTRDMFLLIYSRFFHMAPAPSPKRHPDGSYDEGWDALWHIRAFETMLNETWSGACLVGQWISFDEQMVLCVGRTAKFMLRYMPKKPIKNGLKLWAVACFSGYCFASYTDGGFVGDPKLRKWADCPLGRTCRMVLFVLFGACPNLAEQLLQSGTYVAMDNFFFFACPLQLPSLARVVRCGYTEGHSPGSQPGRAVLDHHQADPEAEGGHGFREVRVFDLHAVEGLQACPASLHHPRQQGRLRPNPVQ
ncbi:unnamed protein product [Pylaiella littoralis]